MKKIRILSLLFAVLMFFCAFGICAQADSPEVGGTESFYGALSNLVSEYDSEDYFAAMTMKLNDTSLEIDGIENEMDEAPYEENGTLMIPVSEIAPVFSDVEVMSLEGEEPCMMNEQEVEQLFECEIETAGEDILITRRFQTKRIIVFSENAVDTGAAAKLENDGVTILQYESIEDAKTGVKLNEAAGYYAEPDIVFAVEDWSWGYETVGADKFHQATGGYGEEVVVAVVDSGINASHPHFEDRLVEGYDCVENDKVPQDTNGHGSHVASTVVSVAKGNENVKIMPVRVFGSGNTTPSSIIASGIGFATEKNVDIINLSLGGYDASSYTVSAAKKALNKGIIVVAAAGNDGYDLTKMPHYPSSVQGVISVSAVDSDNALASFSNYGEGHVDFAAPGVYIYAADHDSSGMVYMSGTSMATPHVSGVYALVKSVHPNLSNDVITKLLKENTKYKGKTATHGAGIINIADFEKSVNSEFKIYGIEGVRAAKTTIDEKNKEITVLASDTNASAGFTVSALVNSLKDYAVESGKNITRSGSDGKVYFVAKQENGKEQKFEIYITDIKGTVHTYSVTIKFISFEPTDYLGLRTYSVKKNNSTIMVTADNRESTIGFAPVLDDMFGYEYVWRTSSEGGTKISDGTTDKYISANTGNTGEYGKVNMNIFPKSNGDKQRLYLRVYLKGDRNAYQDFSLSIDFVFDPDAVKFNDIVTLRADNVEFEETTKTIKVTVDRFNVSPSAKSGTVGFGVVADSGVKVKYTYDAENSTGEETGFMTTTSTAKYTSYKTGENSEASGDGAYGKVKLVFFNRASVTSKATVTLTQGDKSTTYNVTVVLRDMATEGNVSVKGVEVLRANKDSVVIDNANKTIYFEAPKKYTSAGIAVAVNNGLDSNTRTRRIITAVKGYNLAHGNINKTANPELADKFDRYVVARRSMGLEQTFKVVVHGGKQGRTSTVYTVTIKFV